MIAGTAYHPTHHCIAVLGGSLVADRSYMCSTRYFLRCDRQLGCNSRTEYSYLVLVVDDERLCKFLEQGLFVEVHLAVCEGVVAAIVVFEEDIRLKIPIEGQEQGDEMPSN
jgi:hypothetical protein